MCNKVTSIKDFVDSHQATRREKYVKRGQMIQLRNRIEDHKKQAGVYTEVGNESTNEADKFIANGFAQEEIKKANELQRQLDEMK